MKKLNAYELSHEDLNRFETRFIEMGWVYDGNTVYGDSIADENGTEVALITLNFSDEKIGGNVISLDSRVGDLLKEDYEGENK